MIVIILLRFRNDVSLKLNTLSAMFLNFFYPFQIVSKSTVGPSTGILRGCHGIQSRYLEEYPGFFLPNPGKNEYSTVKRFRSISLTSFILKTLEGLVDHFIRHDIVRFTVGNMHILWDNPKKLHYNHWSDTWKRKKR